MAAITTPARAKELLAAIKMGRCKCCGKAYRLNADGKVYKHGDTKVMPCVQDFPSVGLCEFENEEYFSEFDLNSLAEIAIMAP